MIDCSSISLSQLLNPDYMGTVNKSKYKKYFFLSEVTSKNRSQCQAIHGLKDLLWIAILEDSLTIPYKTK